MMFMSMDRVRKNGSLILLVVLFSVWSGFCVASSGKKKTCSSLWDKQKKGTLNERTNLPKKRIKNPPPAVKKGGKRVSSARPVRGGAPDAFTEQVEPTTVSGVWGQVQSNKDVSDRKFEVLILELQEQRKQSDRQYRQMQKQINNTLEKVNQEDKKWGNFVELLVKNDFIRVMRKRKIFLNSTRAGVKTDVKHFPKYEFDIIGVGKRQVVIVEVKATLRENDTDRFLEKLAVIKKLFPEYKNKVIYGAMGYLEAKEGAIERAEQEGLLLVQGVWESTVITNSEGFVPRAFP